MKSPVRKEAVRRTLTGLRDEFRQLFLKYPPLNHERFSSPLEVTGEGWRGFADANFTGAEKGHWYVASGNLWLGRFQGANDGLPDFLDLCHRLGKVLFDPRIGSLAARSQWLDDVHDLAELRATPLLGGKVWLWKSVVSSEADGFDQAEEDLLCDPELRKADREVEGKKVWAMSLAKMRMLASFEMGKILDDAPCHDEQWVSGEQYPAHPWVGSIDTDVFRASAIAIEMVLEPDAMFLWSKPTSATLPFDLGEIVEPELADVAPQTPLPKAPMPGFLFAKSGNLWRIRFQSGQTVEAGEFRDSKGLEYYWQLLGQQGRTVTALTLSPHGTEAEGNEAAGSVIRANEAFDDEARMAEFSGFREEGTSRTGRFSHDEMLALHTESDQTKKKKIKAELRIKEREFRTGIEAHPDTTPSTQAFNRVKAALRRARTELRKHGMPRLADHLEAHVSTSGKGWVYSPAPSIDWSLETSG
jgi:hypothetical protein